MSKFHKKTETIWIVLSLLLLFMGGLIYLKFRPHSLVMFSWLRKLRLESCFQTASFNTESKIQSFCVYSLPNGLWSLSAIIFFGLIWKGAKRLFLLYSVTFSLGNIVFEFLQLFRVIPGTFDMADVIVLLVSLVVGIFMYEFCISTSWNIKNTHPSV